MFGCFRLVGDEAGRISDRLAKNKTEIVLRENDFVFFTNGSITESSDNGSWDTPAKLKGVEESGAWTLWKKIAKKDPSFGNPIHFVTILICKSGTHLPLQ